MTQEEFLKCCAASNCLTETKKYIKEIGKDVFCNDDFIEVYRRAERRTDLWYASNKKLQNSLHTRQEKLNSDD